MSPHANLRELAFTPRQQEQLMLIADAVAKYVRGTGDALAQLIETVSELVVYGAVRAEALERLLVAKGLVTPEELRDTLAAYEAERMVDRALEESDDEPA